MRNDSYWRRFANSGTILSIVSLVGLLMIQFGFKIDLEWLDTTARLTCSLGVVMGILNNPTTGGVDIPGLVKPEPLQFEIEDAEEA